ncbi:hypothetical protein [Paenochrobactrum glaciei]|uniref:Uncharacterized protein n=1 Tax=Paenochrobactrum glaciei TaxID=486407 RepID=A0ABN1GQW2_9HYPH
MRTLKVCLLTLTAGYIAHTSHAFADSCDSKPGDVVAVDKEYSPRLKPDAKAGKIKNEKLSKALKETHYHEIDPSTTVRRLCSQGDWTEVQIVTPEWLTHVQGWVPTKNLRVMQVSASGKRVYIENDLHWNKDTSKHKAKIVPIVNKIFNERTGCDDINTNSIQKFKKSKDEFSVMCVGKPGFEVKFKLSDIDKEFKDPMAVSKVAAIEACEKAAKAKATHPSTVSFSKFINVSFLARPDGSAVLQSKFTAKNALNLQVEYQIQCLFEGNALVEANVFESK